MEFKYNCDNCGFKTNYISQWNKHIATELHQTGKRKTRTDKKRVDKCPHCEYTSNENTNMKQHILNEHKTAVEKKSDFKYYCEYCDYGTFAGTLYEKHKLTKKHNTFIKFAKVE